MPLELGYQSHMSKLSPIVSEFATTEAAIAYDRWFRRKVRASIADSRPAVAHDEVMAEIGEVIAAAAPNGDASQ
jgi:hypothetical protein